MARQKQPKQLKVQVNFTPTVDCDARLKRVMELLLRSVAQEPASGKLNLSSESEDINRINDNNGDDD